MGWACYMDIFPDQPRTRFFVNRRIGSRRDVIGGEEDGRCPHKLAKVGTTDDDWLVGRVQEHGLCEDVGNVVLEVAMAEQRQRISGDEPAEFAVAQDQSGTNIDRSSVL